jgi:hypothetical protein
VTRDEVRRPRAHARSMSTRAAAELPPGPLGVPARSWLTIVGKFRPTEKAGPAAGTGRDWRAEKRLPPSRKGSRRHRFALFGAPSPHVQ